MPRFLLNIIDGKSRSYPMSVDAPDMAGIRKEALKSACALIDQDSDAFWSAKEWQMVVTDESGLMLFTLNMHASEAPASMGRVTPFGALDG